MNKATRFAMMALIAVSVLGMAACSKKVKEVPPTDTTDSSAQTTTTGVDTAGRYTAADLDSDSCLRQRVIYFDLDQTNIRPEFVAAMACHAKYLQDRPSARVTLEGHADERGSREYNMGLGERRGNGVIAALMANGASAGQMQVVSYGEERPECNDSYEGCWSRNRRVEIVYTAR